MVETGQTTQMKQYAVTGALTLARDLSFYLQQQRADVWASVGVIGLGHIGRAVLMWLRPFGFRLREWSRSRHSVEGVECYQGSEGLEHFLGGADILIFFLPLTDETRGIHSAEALAKFAAKSGDHQYGAGRASRSNRADSITRQRLS